MLYGSQKRFDKNGDGKLKGAEWQRWYWRTSGDEIEAKERRKRANAAAEQKRAEIAARFADRASDIMEWMYQDLERLEGERKEHAEQTFQPRKNAICLINKRPPSRWATVLPEMAAFLYAGKFDAYVGYHCE